MATLAKLAAATIPAICIGLVFGDQIKQLNEQLPVVIVMLIAIGVIMVKYGAARPDASDEPLETSATWKTAL